MPLRDHFRPPVSKMSSWEGFHAVWPTTMVQQLNDVLPANYAAEPRVRLGTNFEIDVTGFELDRPRTEVPLPFNDNGGVSVATYAPPQPMVSVDADLGPEFEYAVEIYDHDRGRQLVAAVEIVSPGNKDRPETRRSFVVKCESLLRRNVCVTIIDLVSIRNFNLYRELLEGINQSDSILNDQSPMYAATCRNLARQNRWRLETWPYALTVGKPLPELPVWISEDEAVPLQLETSYESACRTLRIP